jgi:hypothetical protein
MIFKCSNGSVEIKFFRFRQNRAEQRRQARDTTNDNEDRSFYPDAKNLRNIQIQPIVNQSNIVEELPEQTPEIVVETSEQRRATLLNAIARRQDGA